MSTKVDESEFMMELADRTGVACATVKDGHVLVFTKAQLEQLVAKAGEAKDSKVVIFVKRPDFQN